ncbi:MAG: ABC transporter permease [bacterium]|nr:ABC transporter permease [bacterium]
MLRPILVLIRKEFQQILRDRPMLGAVLVMPIMQLFILSFTVTTDVKNLRLIVFDQDLSGTTRQIVSNFEHCGYFILKGYAATQTELESAIQDGKADFGMVFPRNFQADLEMGYSPVVQLIMDGQNSNTASISLGYSSRILQEYAQNILLQKKEIAGRKPLPIHLIEARSRVFYNPALKSLYYMIPGIMAILLTVMTMMLSSMGLVREKEIGTLEQLLVTPMRPYQLLIGKLVPFAAIGFFMLCVSLGMARLVFSLPMEGNLGWVFLATALFMLSTLGMGLFVSTIASTQQQAMFFAWFFMVFGMLMSGYFYAVENMPVWAQYVTLINPLRYYIAVLREVFLKGSSIGDLYFEFTALAVMGVMTLSATVMRFRARL